MILLLSALTHRGLVPAQEDHHTSDAQAAESCVYQRGEPRISGRLAQLQTASHSRTSELSICYTWKRKSRFDSIACTSSSDLASVQDLTYSPDQAIAVDVQPVHSTYSRNSLWVNPPRWRRLADASARSSSQVIASAGTKAWRTSRMSASSPGRSSADATCASLASSTSLASSADW